MVPSAQVFPVQQSPVLVHTPPLGWQAVGVAHLPPTQACEQHCELEVQVVALERQAAEPPSGKVAIPPSGRIALPPSGSVEGSWQAFPSSLGLQKVPVQHSASNTHDLPIGEQRGAGEHRRNPPSEGRQGEPLQHWSLNAQSSPAAMQQPGPASTP